MNGRTIDQNAWTKGLLQIRNTPHKATDLIPAIFLYGHPVQDRLPAHLRHFERDWYNQVGEYDQKMYESEVNNERYYNTSAKSGPRELPAFKVGDEVAVQNTKNKRFNRCGVMVL